MRTLIVATIILSSVTAASSADHPLLRPCLRGGDNAEAIAQSKQACTEYLADLMRSVRFGTSINSPFCVPNRELTGAELTLINKKFSAENPDISEMNAMMLSTVIAVKAYHCSSN